MNGEFDEIDCGGKQIVSVKHRLEHNLRTSSNRYFTAICVPQEYFNLTSLQIKIIFIVAHKNTSTSHHHLLSLCDKRYIYC